jgi:cytolysin (calcineurin-like family phosphatase)
VEDDPETAFMIQNLLVYYVTPHIYPKNSSGLPMVEYAPIPGQTAEIRQFVTNWWSIPVNRTAAYAKLQYMVDRYSQHNDLVSASTIGLCAETYPLVGVG